VLALLLQGLPNKLIARELNLSVETVKDHVAAVLRALGVSTRTQAVLAVSQMTQQAARAALANGRRHALSAMAGAAAAQGPAPAWRRRRRRAPPPACRSGAASTTCARCMCRPRPR
jgi:hypothetical protein